jgi:hypothetical protein
VRLRPPASATQRVDREAVSDPLGELLEVGAEFAEDVGDEQIAGLLRNSLDLVDRDLIETDGFSPCTHGYRALGASHRSIASELEIAQHAG